MRDNIVRFLEIEGEATTAEVFAHINRVMHSGTTMNQLGNLLAKDPRFVLISLKRVSGFTTSYNIQNYKLSTDYREWTYR